jgi:hypothetical protein
VSSLYYLLTLCLSVHLLFNPPTTTPTQHDSTQSAEFAARTAHRSRLLAADQLLVALKDAIDSEYSLPALRALLPAAAAAPASSAAAAMNGGGAGGAADGKGGDSKAQAAQKKKAGESKADSKQQQLQDKELKEKEQKEKEKAAAAASAAGSGGYGSGWKDEYLTAEALALQQYVSGVRAAIDRCVNAAATATPAPAVSGAELQPSSQPAAAAAAVVPVWKREGLVSVALRRLQQATILCLRHALGLPSAQQLVAAGANFTPPHATTTSPLPSVSASASASVASSSTSLTPVLFTAPSAGQLTLPLALHSSLPSTLPTFKSIMHVMSLIVVAHRWLPVTPLPVFTGATESLAQNRVDREAVMLHAEVTLPHCCFCPFVWVCFDVLAKMLGLVVAWQCLFWLDTCTSLVNHSALQLLDKLLAYVSTTPGAPGSGFPAPAPSLAPTASAAALPAAAAGSGKAGAAAAAAAAAEAAANAAAAAAAFPALATVAGMNPEGVEDAEVINGLVYAVENFPPVCAVRLSAIRCLSTLCDSLCF